MPPLKIPLKDLEDNMKVDPRFYVNAVYIYLFLRIFFFFFKTSGFLFYFYFFKLKIFIIIILLILTFLIIFFFGKDLMNIHLIKLIILKVHIVFIYFKKGKKRKNFNLFLIFFNCNYFINSIINLHIIIIFIKYVFFIAKKLKISTI